MKDSIRSITLLFCLVVFPVVCRAANPEEGYTSFVISFEQDGQPVAVADHVVTLQKKPFGIIVSFLGYHGKPVAIRLKSGYDNVYFRKAQRGIPVTELAGVGLGMAEARRPDKDLFFSPNKSVHYWFVDQENSRFHKVVAQGDQLIGKRLVTGFYDTARRQHMLVEDCPVNAFFLVFLTVRHGTVAQQEYFKIQFLAQ